MVASTENDSQAGPVSDEDLGEAALIATFYGPSGEDSSITTLHQLLYRQLASESQEGSIPDDSIPDNWDNREEECEEKEERQEKYGHLFCPRGRAAVDTSVVQVALNARGNAAEAWKCMRQTLRSALYGDQTSEDAHGVEELLKSIWGYSLVYQAVLKEGFALNDAPDASIKSIGRLDPLEPLDRDGPPESLQPLEAAYVPGGKVWLLAIPDEGDGWEAGTLYCAIGPLEGQETLLDRFYGRAAVLLTPDLIAHKGYYQMRQYRSEDLEQGYETRLRLLRQATETLLQGMEQDEEGDEEQDKEGDEEQDKIEHSIKTLANNYYQLMPTLFRLKELHTGITRQLKNYELWRERVGGNSVVDFHGDHLEAAADELELMVQPLEDALDTADKSVNLARTELARSTEHQDQIRHRAVTGFLILIEGTLASVTVLLSAVELMTGWRHAEDNLCVTIVIAVIAIAIITGIWWWVVRRWRSLGS